MATTTTLTEALERIGLTTSHPSTRDMLRALTAAAAELHSRDAIEINAHQDVRAFKARFTHGELSLLDATKEAAMLTERRAHWAKVAREHAERLDAARRAVEAHVTATIARQRTIPTEAARVPKSDTTASLLARLVEATERAEAAGFVRDRDAADVVARFVAADEADFREAAFLRHVEDADLGGYLRLNSHAGSDAVVKLTQTLRAKVRERQDARIGQDEREALDLLPKVAADVTRNLAAITGTPGAAANLLTLHGTEGTKANPRLVAQAARLAADTEAAPAVEALR